MLEPPCPKNLSFELTGNSWVTPLLPSLRFTLILFLQFFSVENELILPEGVFFFPPGEDVIYQLSQEVRDFFFRL